MCLNRQCWDLHEKQKKTGGIKCFYVKGKTVFGGVWTWSKKGIIFNLDWAECWKLTMVKTANISSTWFQSAKATTWNAFFIRKRKKCWTLWYGTNLYFRSYLWFVVAKYFHLPCNHCRNKIQNHPFVFFLGIRYTFFLNKNPKRGSVLINVGKYTISWR